MVAVAKRRCFLIFPPQSTIPEQPDYRRRRAAVQHPSGAWTASWALVETSHHRCEARWYKTIAQHGKAIIEPRTLIKQI